MHSTSVIKTGNLSMNTRVWCATNILLSGTLDTIEDARDETEAEML